LESLSQMLPAGHAVDEGVGGGVGRRGEEGLRFGSILLFGSMAIICTRAGTGCNRTPLPAHHYSLQLVES